jgi:hypothetical protein
MLIIVLLGITLGFTGVMMLMLPAWTKRKKEAWYNAWPELMGEVISSTINNQTVPAANNEGYADVLVRYQFHSGGQLRFDSQVVGTFPKAKADAARDCAARYMPGNAVPVFCDPVDVNHSLLIRPVYRWRVAFITGCVLIALAIGAILFPLISGS